METSARHRLPPLDESETRVNGPERKRRIGVVRSFPAPLDALTDTTSFQVPEGEARVMGVTTPGALSTRVRFEKVALPPGARLFVYSIRNPEEVYGPYEASGPLKDGTFWTPPVEGDSVAIEYFSPAGDKGEAPFQVTQLSHIYADPLAQVNGPATPCNNEVASAYASAARAVGHLQYTLPDGDYICTGTLLNTRSGSFIPYLITANHCFNTQSAAQSLRVFWNYNTGDYPTFSTPRTDGATILATNSASDFTFVRLTGTVPGGLWFNGWSTTMPALNDTVTGIHHPNGSHKRQSFGNVVSRVCPTNLPGACQNYITVRYSSGVTEGGSSGSELLVGPATDPIYVGNLWGGNDSCDNPSGVSIYGRFDVTFPAIRGYLEDSTPPPACTSSSIGFGQTVGGSLASTDCRSSLRGSSYYADRHTFSGVAGQQVSISLASSSFDAYLYLVGTAGQLLTYDDDSGGGLDSRIVITLPSSGTYTVESTSYSENSTGSYALSIRSTSSVLRGFDSIGIHNPFAGAFFLKNTLAGGSADAAFFYGPAGFGWIPVSGDWNGDGFDTVGLYNPSTGTFYLRNGHAGGNADIVFSFGPAGFGWRPVSGDWNGDGVDTIGLYNPSQSAFFLKNTHSGGQADLAFFYGPAG
ncbi:MAG TPA: pre-peptidase C-terminal domain-containing protein, partial [Pyrinomonadaceae bacterium]